MAHGNEVNNKRYYWLKLGTNFFKNARIIKLRKLAGGDTYTIIYLKLLLLSIDNDGLLVYEGIEDTFEEELSLKISEDVENIQVTINYLKAQGLIEEKDVDYFLPEAKASIGSETHNNLLKRSKKVSDRLENFQPNSNQIPIEIDKEKDIEIDKELEKDNIYCPSPSEENDVPKYKIPLTNNEFGNIYQKDIDLYKSAYPAIDVDNEINRIISWCISNPKNVKTKNGYKRFVNSWLARAQDRKPKANTDYQEESHCHQLTEEELKEQLKDYDEDEVF